MQAEEEGRNFNRDMDAAPKDELLILLVPTGDPEDPLSYQEAQWDDIIGQWHGPWRNEDGDGAYPHAEPIAFCQAPDEDDEDWDTNMEEADRNFPLLFKVPTGDPEIPISYEIGEWSEDDQEWVGAWRNTAGEEGDYSEAEPIAWMYLPDVDADIMKEFGIEPVEA